MILILENKKIFEYCKSFSSAHTKKPPTEIHNIRKEKSFNKTNKTNI